MATTSKGSVVVVTDRKTPDAKLDPALQTRNICAAGLGLGWIFSLACIIVGAIMLSQGHYVVPEEIQGKAIMVNFCEHDIIPSKEYSIGHRIQALYPGTSVLVELSITILITIVLDCTNYIHAITLKWALFHEGRLEFNSNIRLFTSARARGPNCWYINLISLIGLAISYGALSCIFVDVVIIGVWDDQTKKIQYTYNSPSADIIDINGLAILALGIGLFLQACVSTYSLMRSDGVKTWDSGLLANARAWVDTQRSVWACSQEETHGRTILHPRKKQASMLSVVPQVQVVRRLIWVFCGLFTVWSLVQGSITATLGYMMEDIVQGSPSSQKYWRYYGSMWVQFFYIPGSSIAWLGLVLQTLGQSFITFGLHCVELLFNLSRDEAAWRSMETIGSELSPSILSNFSWEVLLMVAFKAIVQWVYGYAFTADATLNFALLPVIALAVLFIVLAIVSEYMLRKRPVGSLPAVYGNFARLTEFVDEWDHTRLFWGDKGALEDTEMPMRCAGTAGQRLADLWTGTSYCIQVPRMGEQKLTV